MNNSNNESKGNMKNSLRAFVIMPFGNDFDVIYSSLIIPPLEEVGYNVIRADSIIDRHNILKDIIRNIAEADLVVADLTSINPNVFYELGIAHAMLIPTILLTQSIDEVPFDLKSYRVITYTTSFFDAKELSKRIKEIAEKAKNNNLSFGNPISDFLPEYKIKIKSNEKDIKEEQEVKEIIKIEEDKGFWDFIADSEKSIENIGEITNKISEETKIIGEKFKTKTEELNSIYNAGIPGTASRIQKLINSTSIEIRNYARSLEELQPKFHDAWVDLDDNMSGFLRIIQIRTEDDKKSGIEFRSKIVELKDITSKTQVSLSTYKESINSLKGQSRELNIASRETVSVLDLILSDMQGAESYLVKLIDLINEKIKE